MSPAVGTVLVNALTGVGGVGRVWYSGNVSRLGLESGSGFTSSSVGTVFQNACMFAGLSAMSMEYRGNGKTCGAGFLFNWLLPSPCPPASVKIAGRGGRGGGSKSSSCSSSPLESLSRRVIPVICVSSEDRACWVSSRGSSRSERASHAEGFLEFVDVHVEFGG